ncbi:MAG: uroporphyrinogen-III synthase [Pseudohongiellaceae bacterium]
MSREPASTDLAALRVAVPETRQLDILADLLERRGAEVQRLPLVNILDVEDPRPVEQWLHRFIDEPGDLLIVLTGEGIRRLRGFAQRAGLEDDFRQALARTHKLCRGPKPGRALKEMDLKADATGAAPTTPGIIETLENMNAARPLKGQRVCVQLYGQDPNRLLMDFLLQHGVEADTVAPYRYAPGSDEAKIVAFIHSLNAGQVDAITFTSQPQFRRLLEVARKHSMEQSLLDGMQRVLAVAVGPVVGDQLASHGIRVEVMPEENYFMKPMVTALARHVSKR